MTHQGMKKYLKNQLYYKNCDNRQIYLFILLLTSLIYRCCTACFKTCRGVPSVGCDFCSSIYHLDCLDPPLCEIPRVRNSNENASKSDLKLFVWHYNYHMLVPSELFIFYSKNDGCVQTM